MLNQLFNITLGNLVITGSDAGLHLPDRDDWLAKQEEEKSQPSFPISLLTNRQQALIIFPPVRLEICAQIEQRSWQ